MSKDRITLLAPRDVIETAGEIGCQTESFALRSDVYSDSREILELFRRHGPTSEGILIGGPLAHDHLMERMADAPELRGVCIGYIPYDETAIFRALFELARDRVCTDLGSTRLSIDHPAGAHIRECVEEIDLGVANTFSRECVSAEDATDLVSFHHDLWRRGEVSAALTSVYAVHVRLRALSVPVYRIHPAKSAIRSAFGALEGRLREKRALERQIAVVMLRLRDAATGAETVHLRHVVNRRRLFIDRQVGDIARRIHGVLQWTSPVDAQILSTRRQVETQIFSEDTGTLLADLRQELGIGIAVVIGVAETANDALELARSPEHQHGGQADDIRLVDAGGVVTHSFDTRASVHYARSSCDPDLLRRAELARLGIGSVQRVLSIVQARHPVCFAADQLADWLNVTPRSARRIIARLEQAGLVERCGMRQSVGRGRPTRLFRPASGPT